MGLGIFQKLVGPRGASHRDFLRLAAAAAVIGVGLPLMAMGISNPSGAAVDQRAMRIAKAASGGFSDVAFHAATSEMDPAMIALARRFDPAVHDAGRLILPPQLNPMAQGAVLLQEAATFNEALPFSTAPNPAARPFSLASATSVDQDRALECMTQAIYFEAGFEPEDGQRAVAQVVINRLRHPAFPKTVCGVVYQGSDRPTGCQFSFTCDGSLARQPAAWAWERARKVARAALNGYVMKAVGGATHYHTDYVAPYWAPRLFKVSQIGAHIFYRWPDAWGLPGAFNGRYAGMERPGIDLGGDPNRIDLDSLKLAGLEGAADAAQNAPQVLAALDVPTARSIVIAATVSDSPVLAPEPQADAPAQRTIVNVPPMRPKTAPRLAMPN